MILIFFVASLHFSFIYAIFSLSIFWGILPSWRQLITLQWFDLELQFSIFLKHSKPTTQSCSLCLTSEFIYHSNFIYGILSFQFPLWHPFSLRIIQGKPPSLRQLDLSFQLFDHLYQSHPLVVQLEVMDHDLPQAHPTTSIVHYIHNPKLFIVSVALSYSLHHNLQLFIPLQI